MSKKSGTPPANDTRCIKRIARVVPFGYKAHDVDTTWLVPVLSELNALEEALEYLKTSSLREVAAWLSAKTGRRISHMGLKKIAKQRSGRYPTTKAKTVDRGSISDNVNGQVSTGAA